MTMTAATLDIAKARLHAQHLVRPLATPVDVVAHLLAVQSQDYPGAAWALAQRAKATTAETVDTAFAAGTILRTHVMRPTWHFVTPADARWLLELTGPRVQKANTYWYKQVGLTAATLAKTDAALADALRGGNFLTRDELAARLPRKLSGVPMAHVMMHAELERVVISGPRRGKQFTYALFDERVPASPALTRDDALARIATRYVTSHGPAQVKDFVWWSGLGAGDARRALELAGFDVHEVGSARYYVAVQPSRRLTLADPTVHLLPNYDECLVAFADRSDACDPRVKQKKVSVLSGHFVISNGKLIGGWRRGHTTKKALVIRATLLAKATRAELSAMKGAADQLGTFLGTPTRIEIAYAT
ncbi:MAG: winged helix DNA-binding domain-containing protein [Kofleriaceae bacterium]